MSSNPETLYLTVSLTDYTSISSVFTFDLTLVDPCSSATITISTISDLSNIRVNDPFETVSVRNIIASNDVATSYSIPDLCGDYTYAYEPTDPSLTFPTQLESRFDLTGNAISFYSDDVTDANIPAFMFSVVVTLVNYSSIAAK